MTGRFGSRVRDRAMSASPSIPGMRRSVISASNELPDEEVQRFVARPDRDRVVAAVAKAFRDRLRHLEAVVRDEHPRSSVVSRCDAGELDEDGLTSIVPSSIRSNARAREMEPGIRPALEVCARLVVRDDLRKHWRIFPIASPGCRKPRDAHCVLPGTARASVGRDVGFRSSTHSSCSPPVWPSSLDRPFRDPASRWAKRRRRPSSRQRCAR